MDEQRRLFDDPAAADPPPAQRAVAQLQLRRTEVRAPAAGRIAQADRLQTGQQVVLYLPVRTGQKAKASPARKSTGKSAPARRGGKPSKVKRR